MENEQKLNEPITSTEPATSKRKTGQAEVLETVFQLSDLNRLTWKQSDDQELDVWSSTAQEFQTFVSHFGSVGNVDITVWSVFDRLDYINGLYAYCQMNRYCFPFQVKPVEQPVSEREQVGT